MSLETWKQEFYPIPADQVPEDQALDHSIKKWEGLQPDNYTRHGIRIHFKRVVDIVDPQQDFDVSSSTCALCHHHSDTAGCDSCPIRGYKGTDSEDVCDDEEACLNEYCQFLSDKDTKPMLDLLKAVKAAQ